ncbi:MAG: hypothetical protein AAF587_27215 [Bacteroidota bacterium]
MIRGVFLGLACLHLACGTASDKAVNEIAQQLVAQIESSCSTATAYQKTVFDLDEFAAQGQDSLFSPIPVVVVGTGESGQDSMNFLPLKDLSYAFEAFYSDESFEGQFAVEQRADSLIAELKPEYSRNAFLQKQVIVSAPESDVIQYFENQLNRDTWFYDMHVSLQIWFDPDGKYLRHSLELHTAVSLISSSFHARIDGKNLYP